ncbi:MAG: hypothetical protein R3C16_04760 [Hyphomonadaceae bacterium]
MQSNWIGKSQGARFRFDIVGSEEKIEVFTTRPDTLFGASFVALASDHPLTKRLAESNKDVAAFIAKTSQLRDVRGRYRKSREIRRRSGHPGQAPV